MTGLDKRHVAGSGDVEAAEEYEIPLHQLGSGSDDDDDDGKATEVPTRGHSSESDTGFGVEDGNRRRLL